MRVKNPQRLAEVLLGIDKGWSAQEVEELLDGEPEEIGVPLNHHIPVHIAYFTAQVDDAGDVTTEKDVYGHEKRITQALEGDWNAIDKGPITWPRWSWRSASTTPKAPDGRRRGAAAAASSAAATSMAAAAARQRVVSRGNSANDIFRQSFGY